MKGIHPLIYKTLKSEVGSKSLSYDEAKKLVEEDPAVKSAGFKLRKDDYEEFMSKKASSWALNELVCLADEFDKAGLHAQASKLDRVIKTFVK